MTTTLNLRMKIGIQSEGNMEENKHQIRNELFIDALSSIVVGASVVVITLLTTWATFGKPDWKTAVGLGSGLATYFFLVGK